MSLLLRAVHESVDGASIAQRCRKNGCAVSLEGVPRDRVLVDLDLALEGAGGKRCDFLLAADADRAGWVVLMELKSGNAKAGEVGQQLQGGAAAVSAWLPRDLPYRFLPVLAHGKGLHRTELKKLRRIRIRLDRHRAQPELIRCGAKLSDVLR